MKRPFDSLSDPRPSARGAVGCCRSPHVSVNWLLAAVPTAAAIAGLAPDAHVWIFLLSALSIVPLAATIGTAAERLAERVGPTIGGLVTATFGNAPELIIALAALREGLHDVIKAAIAGSVVGNVLLVLGAAALAGGLRHRTQCYNVPAAHAQVTLLVLAVTGMLVPALYQGLIPPAASHLGALSVGIAMVLIAIYVCGLVFTLVTHRELFTGEVASGSEAVSGGLGSPLLRLGFATLATAWMSGLLVGSVEQAAAALSLGTGFVSVFVVASAGNAAALLAAIRAARRDRLDLALSIAIGSSTQVVLLVAPAAVLASLVLGPAPLDLAFHPGLVLAVILAVLICVQLGGDGRSDWLKGVQLLGVYVILALAFFYSG